MTRLQTEYPNWRVLGRKEAIRAHNAHDPNTYIYTCNHVGTTLEWTCGCSYKQSTGWHRYGNGNQCPGCSATHHCSSCGSYFPSLRASRVPTVFVER